MMTSTTVALTVLCVLLYSASLTFSKKHHEQAPPPGSTCGNIYNATNGTITINKKSAGVPKDVTDCYWTVTSLKNQSIFLVFDVYLVNKDKLTIKVGDKELPHSDNIKSGIIPYVTNYTSVNISILTDATDPHPTRSLRIYYYTISEYNHTMTKTAGILRSPLYDPEGFTSWPVVCNFHIIPQDSENHYLMLWLQDFNFNQTTLSVTGSEKHDGKYIAGNFSDKEFLAKKQLDLEVTINSGLEDPEKYVAFFDEVSAACSDVFKLVDDMTQTITGPSLMWQPYIAVNQQSLNCQWLVDADDGKTITITMKDTKLPSAMDQLLILDGPSRNSLVLLDINVASDSKQPVLYSTGKSLWVSASTPFFNESFAINIDVSTTKSGGHMRSKGTVTLNGDDGATFLLEVDSGKQVQLMIDNSATSVGTGTVSFYQDFTLSGEPFNVLSSGKKMDVVVSPTEKMAVVMKDFKKSKFSGSFSGIEQGCYKYGQASGDTFSVSGHCNSTCAWIVKPVASSEDMLTFHFNSLNLGADDHVFIQKLDSNQTKVANITSDQSVFPDLWLPAVTGAFLQVTRGNCMANSIAIQSSFQVVPGCQTVLNPGAGEKVTITSNGYPNHYPLGAVCSWVIVKPSNVSFLHVSFKDIQLAQKDHSLKVFVSDGPKVTQIMEFNGTNQTLPDDVPVFGNIMVNFTTSTSMPMQSMPGFMLDILAIEFGSLMVNSSGVIETPDFPKPVKENSLFAWIVKINSTDSAKQILDFAFSNQTNGTGIPEVLKIHDGASLRSGLLTNYTTSGILSRTNELIFVYQNPGNISGPAFSISYNNFPCNMSLLCYNHICMHEDWICNGLNDCGDFTDELHCDGGYTPPTPPPIPPTPAPSESTKGVSTAALAVGILIALVIGAVLGFGGPFAIKKLRGRGAFQSYSSFTNNME